MERKKQVINVGKAVASPVLTGTNDQYMWTGFVKSDNIDENIIPNDKKRKDLVVKLRELEQYVLTYRKAHKSFHGVLKIKPEESLESMESEIVKLCREIKTMINNNNPEIDMDLYWVAFCREYEKIKEKNPNEFTAMDKETRKNLENFREFVNKNDPPIREMYSAENNQYACVQFLTRGQEKKTQKIKDSNIDNLLGIIENIAGKEDVKVLEGSEILKDLCGAITLIDIPTIFHNKRYADMQYITMFKNYLLRNGFTFENIEKMSDYELVEEAMKSYNNCSFDFHASLISDTIVNGIDCIDLEKALLINAARVLEAYEELMAPKLQISDPIEAEVVQKLAEKEEETFEKLGAYHVEECNLNEVIERNQRAEFVLRKVLESGIIDKRTRVKIFRGDTEKEISLKNIEELMENFCDGIYLSETMQLALIFDAYKNENAIKEGWTDQLIKKINLSNNDMNMLSAVNFENLERFYSLGKMNKEDIKNLITDVYNGILDKNVEATFGDDKGKEKLIKQHSRDLLRNLYNSKIINEKDIAEYFDEGIISIEQLESLEEEKSPEEVSEMHAMLKQEFNDDRLLLSYKNYVVKYNEFVNFQKEHPEDTERIEQLREELKYLRSEKEKYREVFNKYNHIQENEKVSLGEDLLAKYYVELDVAESDMQESIKLLYEDGFIQLENIINLDKKEQKYLIPMLDSLTIKDTDKIRSNMTFEELINMVDNIFTDPTFNDERRWIIIMNLFIEDTEQDKEAREGYLEMLDFDNKSERKAKSKGTRTIIDPKPTKDFDKKVYPDAVKWKFYKALDKDARITRYSNGFVEFASSKLNARIIEKYYDGNKQAYGTATCILPEDKYRKNEGDLITIIPNGLILESTTLKEITPRKDRIAHITKSTDKTWMDQIIKYFDIDFEREDDSRYSKEELKELKETVSKYKTKYISETEK